jgi:hypothetical protein
MRLSQSEKALIVTLRRQTASVLGPKRNPVGPDRATVEQSDAAAILRVNRFIRRGFIVFARKLTGTDRKIARFRAAQVSEVSKRIKQKLMGSKPISRLIITGNDAVFYFGALEATHKHFSAVAKNYVEASKDPKQAEVEAKEALWAIRSLIQVGHMPVEKSRFLK